MVISLSSFSENTFLVSQTDNPEERIDETTTWPDLAISLYDRLTGRNAEITYEFEDMEVDVPSGTGDDADHAHWRVDGTLRVTTREQD
nr:hypothetical protein [Halomicrobium mukohataei]